MNPGLGKELKMERYTDRMRKVMSLANEEANRLGHEYVGTEHILLAIVKEGSGVGATVLKRLGLDLDEAQRGVVSLMKILPAAREAATLPLTPRSKNIVKYAAEEATSLRHNYVGTEHLLLGLLREKDGVGAQVLLNFGLRLEQVREEVKTLLGTGD